jgi:hypothetical protein
VRSASPGVGPACGAANVQGRLIATRRSSASGRPAGKREQARDHLTTATTMYREMDMQFWLEKAEAEAREMK